MRFHEKVSAVYYFMLFLICLIIGLSVTPVSGEIAQKLITVGTHLPLSGNHAQIGREQKWAYECAVADINSSGGIYVAELGRKLNVKLVVIDDGSSPGAVVGAVHKLIKEYDVDFILSGHTAVLGVIPGSIVAENSKVYYHASGSFIQPWKEHNFQWSTLLFFEMKQLASMPFELLDSLPDSNRPTNIALLMENVYDALAFGKMVRNRAEVLGYRIVLDDQLPSGRQDYSSNIKKLVDQKIDAILLYSSVADSITFIRQLKTKSIDVRFLFGWRGTWPAEFGTVMGEDAQYVVSDGHWSESYPFVGAKELGQRYRDEFHVQSVSVGAFYGSAQVLWQAIEDAGTLNPSSVRHAVLNGKFHTVLGPVEYDQRGVATYPVAAFQWVNNNRNLVYPLNRAQEKLKVPFHGKNY